MGDAGRRPDSKAQGQGAPPLPLPQQRQGADMHEVIFLIDTRQTQHHATQSAAGSGWGAGYGLLLQFLLGAGCAGQQGEPRGCPGVSSSHKALQGHLLAEGNHNSQDASTGTHISLGARSTRLHFKSSSSIQNTVERGICLFSLQEVDSCGVSLG